MARSLRGDIKALLTSASISAVIDSVRGIAIASLLTPYYMGLCGTLFSLVPVSKFLALGTADSLAVAIPAGRGRGDAPSDLDRIREEAGTSGLLIVGVGALLVCLYVVLLSSESARVNSYILLAASLLPIAEARRFLYAVNASDGKFRLLAQTDVRCSLLLTLCQVGLVVHYSVYGFFIGAIVTYSLVVLHLGYFYYRNHGIKLRLSWQTLRRLAPVGLGVIATESVLMLIGSLTKFSLVGFASVKDAGYLVIPLVILAKLALVSRTVRRVVVPSLAEMSSGDRSGREAIRVFLRAQALCLTIVLVLGLCGYFVIEGLLQIGLPDYLPATQASQVACLAAVPRSLIDNANAYLFAQGDQRWANALLVAVLALLAAALCSLGGLSQLNVNSAMGAVAAILVLYAAVVNYRVSRLAKGVVVT